MRIAVYVRVSTHRQVERQSFDHQLERLRTYIETQGWDLCDEHIFRDDGVSGSTLKRPGLERLRERAAVAAFDAGNKPNRMPVRSDTTTVKATTAPSNCRSRALSCKNGGRNAQSAARAQ